MLSDAHCHPFDLPVFSPSFEAERRRLGVIAAASACGIDEFSHNEILSHNADKENAPPLYACFGIHPQIFKIRNEEADLLLEGTGNLLETLEMLASQKRIAAVGECGFDLYNSAFKETEALQDSVFPLHLETALRYELPLVLHVRRAMHKIFSFSKNLAGLKAVIFHSWSGAYEEALALLRRGVNAYFSFGNTIMLNHKQAMKSCALLPEDRLLTETDSPYQPRRGETFSQWADLLLILNAMAALRNEAGNKTDKNNFENQIEINFRKIF